LEITIPGTVIGLAVALMFAWPWPFTPAQAVARMAPNMPWWNVPPNLGPRQGLYPWPFWGPLPQGFAPGGNWQTGLATGVAGLAFGALMLRMMRLLFGIGLGVEALGLGDADLMMMAGAFMGWQPVLVAFFVGVFPALLFGLWEMVAKGGNELPFGPSLAAGIVITMLSWRGIGPYLQPILFNGPWIGALGAVACVLIVVLSYAMRLLRLLRR
jgi:leader peptidase (prepilin peptidase)/N-methyltransferase